MSEGANSNPHNCESSPTTLAVEGQPTVPPSEPVAPATTASTGRRPRFGTGTARTSEFTWVDGKQIRSALAWRKKWPPRRVSFPSNDTHLVTGYLEPANPWERAGNVNREELISTYKKACEQHSTDPLESVLAQLKKLDFSDERSPELSLKGQTLKQSQCESLEEILKRVQFNKIDLEGTSLDDESSVALFDMLEYYESATHLNISSNQNIGARGWQACSYLIKKTQCLEQLDAKNVTLNEQHMPILSRALRLGTHLHVLKLENCGLAGRPIVILAAALKLNTGLKELYLADNDLEPQDAMQLGALLRTNNHLQLLDVSNNNIQDTGVGHISEGLIKQPNDDKDGKGLSILVLWNNHLTRNSSQHFSRAIARSKSLEMLNIGQNILSNEILFIMKDSLLTNRTLLRLGMQSTHLTCEGAHILADVIEHNKTLQRIDLRDNHIQINGLKALANALKVNRSVTQLDLDDKPRRKIDGALLQYKELVAEIRGYCVRNEEPCSPDESTEDSDSPEHRSRLSSVSSRKISLTCQTLPRSPPSIFPLSPDRSGRSLLEPKRTSGGRLRSPAPSPIPSPVASPIPSPSRNRFVVSRVPESSLSSTNSSASSSPVTPTSLSSSPVCFFPPASGGSSRFRVTIVETANTKPSPKSVVSSSNANVTVGFDYKVDAQERSNSEDSDDVFKPDVEAKFHGREDARDGSEKEVTSGEVANHIADDNAEVVHPSEVTVKVKMTDDHRCVVKDIISVESNSDESAEVPSDESAQSKKDNGTELQTEREVNVAENSGVEIEAPSDSDASPANIPVSATSRLEDSADSDAQRVIETPAGTDYEAPLTDKSAESSANEAATPTFSLQPRPKKTAPVPKQPSSLEKLLALFQNPFSSSPSAEKTDATKPLHEGVNNMVALGDKLQQYLKEGRTSSRGGGGGGGGSRESTPPPPLLRSASETLQTTAPDDPVKSIGMSQFSSIQSLTNVFVSCQLRSDPIIPSDQRNEEDSPCNCDSVCSSIVSADLVEQHQQQQQRYTVETRNSENSIPLPPFGREGDTISRLSDRQALPENVQSKENDRRIAGSEELTVKSELAESDTPTECSSEAINSVPVTNAPVESGKSTTLCVPKLKDIPENSVLEISNNSETTKDELLCDSSTTDSINPTSDRTSSPCKILCDMQSVDNVDTLGTTLDSVDNSASAPSKRNKDDGVEGDASTPVRADRCLAVQCALHQDWNFRQQEDGSPSIDRETAEEEKESVGNSEDSFIHISSSPNENNNRKVNDGSPVGEQSGDIDLQDVANLEEGQCANACHVDDSLHRESTIIVDEIDLSAPVLNTTIKDIAKDIKDGHAQISDTSTHEGDEKEEETQDEEEKEEEEEEEIVSSGGSNATQVTETIDKLPSETGQSEDDVATIDQNAHTNREMITTEDRQETKSIVVVPPGRVTFVDLDKSCTEDLIFNMTDIITETTSIEDDLASPSATSTHPNSDSTKVSSSMYDESRHERHSPPISPSNLFIQKPRDVHRNSHDSGIEEATASTPENAGQPILQESVDSGIDSECSSICAKADSGTEISNEQATLADKSIEVDRRSIDEVDNYAQRAKDGGNFSESRTVIKTEDYSSVLVKNTTIETTVVTRTESKTTDYTKVEVNTEGSDTETLSTHSASLGRRGRPTFLEAEGAEGNEKGEAGQ